MSAFIAELIGTAILIVFGSGVVSGAVLDKSKANGCGWLSITLGWAIGITFGVYAAGQFSGGHLNPAVTIALAVTGKFPWNQVPVYIAGQFIGAMIGATAAYFLYLPHWKESKDAGLKLAVFCTGPAIRHTPSNFICEFIATFVLMFVIMVIGANKYAEGLGPVVVGILVLGMGLCFGGPTGYAMNPARDLGPRIMHAILPIHGKGDSDWGYSWIPVVSPICGAVCAALTATALLP